MRRAALVSSLVALVVLVCACGSGPSTQATATVAGSPAPSSAASASAESAARELPADTANLTPDRYARPDLIPGVSFAVDDGWSSGTLDQGSIEIHHAAGGDEVVVMLANVTAESASAAADAVQATQGISVLATSESRMSGHTGPNLEVESTTDTSIDLLSTASSTIALEPDARLWLSLFDTAGGVLAVAVIADGGTWDAALLAAEPFLESVEIAAD